MTKMRDAKASLRAALASRAGGGESRSRAARGAHHATQFIVYLLPWPEGLFNEAQEAWLFSARWLHISQVLRQGASGWSGSGFGEHRDAFEPRRPEELINGGGGFQAVAGGLEHGGVTRQG